MRDKYRILSRIVQVEVKLHYFQKNLRLKMASIENIENLPPLENLTISGHKPQPSKNVKQKLSVSSDRKKLQTLQASGVNDQVLVRILSILYSLLLI